MQLALKGNNIMDIKNSDVLCIIECIRNTINVSKYDIIDFVCNEDLGDCEQPYLMFSAVAELRDAERMLANLYMEFKERESEVIKNEA